MHLFGYAVFKYKVIAKKLIKEGFIMVKAFDKGKGEIITVVVKNVMSELKLLYKEMEKM